MLRSLTAVAILIAVASPASAQGPADEDAALRARARYDAGTRAFADRRFVEAALDFEAAAADKPSAVALYTAALSWEQANVPDRAADDYTRALAGPGLPQEKVGPARDRLGALEAVLGAVAVTGPATTRVQLDANTELGAPALLHGAPGVHTLSMRAGAGQPVERRAVVLETGRTFELDATPAAPAAPREGKADAAPLPAPPPQPAATASWLRPTGFVAAGVGAAFLLSGAVLGAEAIGARDAYRGAPTQATYDHALELQAWTNVAFVAGAVLAAGGVALVVWPAPRAPVASAASLVALPGGVAVRGDF